MDLKKRRIPWNLNKPWSDDVKKKISEAKRGKKESKELCEIKSESLKGRKQPTRTEEHKNNLSKSLKGRSVWNKGIKGIHLSPNSEFKKGIAPWNKDKKGVYSEEAKKKIKEARKKQVAEKNPNWNGGSSFIPYCPKFNKNLKEKIRDRDGRKCQLCPCTEKENGEKLSVHHIHYDRPNCEPDLISLCRKCNSKVNGNREYYEALFIKKLAQRGLIKI